MHADITTCVSATIQCISDFQEKSQLSLFICGLIWCNLDQLQISIHPWTHIFIHWWTWLLSSAAVNIHKCTHIKCCSTGCNLGCKYTSVMPKQDMRTMVVPSKPLLAYKKLWMCLPVVAVLGWVHCAGLAGPSWQRCVWLLGECVPLQWTHDCPQTAAHRRSSEQGNGTWKITYIVYEQRTEKAQTWWAKLSIHTLYTIFKLKAHHFIRVNYYTIARWPTTWLMFCYSIWT